jgi:hypothetical protein
MIDITKLRKYAENLLSNATDSGSVQEVMTFVKLIEEIDNQQTSTLKLQAEIEDIALHRKDAGKGLWKDLVIWVTPLLTTIILAGTLIFQAYTFKKSEADKLIEAQRQTDLAEKTRWADALKVLSASDKISPASALLRSFTTMPYKAYARDLTFALLNQRQNDPSAFAELFKSNLEPVEWTSLRDTLRLNRQLFAQLNPLWLKMWDPKTNLTVTRKLSASETLNEKNLNQDLDITVSAVVSLLKSSRPSDMTTDFRGLYFYQAELSHADLHALDIGSSDFGYATLDGADMSSITSFDYSVFNGCIWWHAAKISAPLMTYLTKTYPFDPNRTDYHTPVPLTKVDYQESVDRLRNSKAE